MSDDIKERMYDQARNQGYSEEDASRIANTCDEHYQKHGARHLDKIYENAKTLKKRSVNEQLKRR